MRGASPRAPAAPSASHQRARHTESTRITRSPRLGRGHGAFALSLGRLQDPLAEEGEAGPSIALTLHELEAVDLAFGDAV